MKKIIVVLMLFISITPDLCAQSNGNEDTRHSRFPRILLSTGDFILILIKGTNLK